MNQNHQWSKVPKIIIFEWGRHLHPHHKRLWFILNLATMSFGCQTVRYGLPSTTVLYSCDIAKTSYLFPFLNSNSMPLHHCTNMVSNHIYHQSQNTSIWRIAACLQTFRLTNHKECIHIWNIVIIDSQHAMSFAICACSPNIDII